MALLKKKNLSLFKLLTYLVFFTTPLESISIIEGNSSFSLTKLIILAQFVIWFFTNRKIEMNSIIKAFVFLGVFWLLSCFWALDFEIAFNSFLLFYLPTIFLTITISASVDNWQDIRNILLSFLLGCIVLAINCQNAKSGVLANAMYADQERITALGQDQNELAFMLNIGIVISLQFYCNQKKWFFKSISLLFVLFFIYVVLLTGSRTGLITTFLIFCIFAIDQKRLVAYLLPLLIILSPFIISLVPDATIERLITTREVIEAGDMSNRGEIWRQGFQAFRQENVVLGVGYQNFTEMMTRYFNRPCVTHNTYLGYLFTGGFVGLFLLIFILKKLFDYCINISKKTHSLFCFSYLLTILIAMITLETQYRRWFFLIAIVLYKAYYLCFEGDYLDRYHYENS